MPEQPPGDGFLGWLGRQIGYVKKAVKTDVTPKEQVVHREAHVEEAKLPERPDVTFRRTVIDEVIVEKKLPNQNEGTTDERR
jgi:hypothetical protein